jgi:hypothetical protein
MCAVCWIEDWEGEGRPEKKKESEYDLVPEYQMDVVVN